jgi:hypothetical protein
MLSYVVAAHLVDPLPTLVAFAPLVNSLNRFHRNLLRSESQVSGFRSEFQVSDFKFQD